MEDLKKFGAFGLAFEYDVVPTPVWSELQLPSLAANCLLSQFGGESLAIGNVSLKYNKRTGSVLRGSRRALRSGLILPKQTHTTANLIRPNLKCWVDNKGRKLYSQLTIFKFMISSKRDYEFYLKADQMALTNAEKFPFYDKYLFPFKLNYDIWMYQRLLRKLEYYTNCRRSIFWKPIRVYLRWSFTRLSQRLGFVIHPNVFGPGLSIAYPWGIIINSRARIGENCRLHNFVHVAQNGPDGDAVPQIGNNVFIGPGAVIVGKIKIADNIAIGANSFVNKSFLEEGITIAGAPARKISDKGSSHVRSTEILRTKIADDPH